MVLDSSVVKGKSHVDNWAQDISIQLRENIAGNRDFGVISIKVVCEALKVDEPLA